MMTADDKRCSLFVYGTLTNPSNVRTIAGRTYPTKKATLLGFEKISSTMFFPYIIRRPESTVHGLLLEGIDQKTLLKFDEFEGEGDLYRREKVTVSADGEDVEAYTYVGEKGNILRYFGRGFVLEDRMQDHLEDRIEAMLEEEKAATPEDRPVLRRARGELYGSAIQELVNAHFDNVGLPEYLIRKGLKDFIPPILTEIADDEKALKYADNYIDLAVRHIIFNQVEHRIRREFRGVVKSRKEMYENTLSSLLALKLVNSSKRKLQHLIAEEGIDRYRPELEYLDYAKAGIRIADALFNRLALPHLIVRVLSHRQEGRTPLGAEIEMSQLGVRAVGAEEGEDDRFDSFYYFHDFDLGRRCRKLGGYIDDHSLPSPIRKRARGFFEYACGRLNFEENIAKPATEDPWMLGELINELLIFADIPPHSMHITLEPPADKEYRVLEEIEPLLCLLMLGGDISPDKDGILREKRIWQEEVISEHVGLCFSKFNVHPAKRSDVQKDMARLVEYQFPRLRKGEPHEVLIMAIKGFQLGYSPLPFISSIGGEKIREYEDMSQALIEWAKHPQPVSERSILDFLNWVNEGLMTEDKGKPSHTDRFIENCLGVMEDKLNEMNLLLAEETNSRTLQK